MLEQYKEIWAIKTLVDITKTNVVRGTGKLRNQQRNFETLLHTVNILSQAWEFGGPPKRETWGEFQKAFKDTGVAFGTKHEFSQEMMVDLNVWTWRFGVEHSEVFGKHGELLVNQLHNIPVITELDENCHLDVPVFDTQSTENRNVLIICETLL